MDWVTNAAQWIRHLLAQQPWLDSWQALIAGVPDWLLVIAGPSAVVLLWVILRLVWPKRSSVSTNVEAGGDTRARSERAPPTAANLADSDNSSPPQSNAAQAVGSVALGVAAQPSAKVQPAPASATGAMSGPSKTASDDAEVSDYLARLHDPDLHRADQAVMVAAARLSGVFGDGDKKGAIAAYERAVASDPKLSHAWHQLGILYGDDGREDASKHAFEKALASAANEGEEGVALCSLGSIANEREDYVLAEDLYTRAAQKLEGVQDEIEIFVKCKRALGAVKYQRGASDAEQAIQVARALAKTHNFPEEELQCVHWLIGIARAQHRPTLALEPLFTAALPLERQLGHKKDQARTLRVLGEIAQIRGDLVTWRSHSEAALSLSRELNDREGMTLALYQLGRIARDSGDADMAYSSFRESLAIVEEIGNKKFMVEVLNQLGDLEYQCDKLDNAAGYLDRALAMATQIGSATGQACALYTLGCVAEDRGNHQEKRDFWTKARERAREAGDDTMVQNLDRLLRET